MPVKLKVSERAAMILKTAEVEGNCLKFTCGQLPREQYLEVNNLLVALGGKWNRKAGGHVFGSDPCAVLANALESEEVIDEKKSYDAFFTPSPLARRLVEMAQLKNSDLVLEPSAGDGAIVREAKPYCKSVHVCEIQHKWHVSLIELGAVLLVSDFLQYRPNRLYDAVIANPPFSSLRDVEHVSHMLDFVRPGGRLVSILSAGFGFRQDKKLLNLKAKLDSLGSWDISDLPNGAFKDAGTDVRSCILSFVGGG